MDQQNTNEYILSSVKNALRILQSFSIDEPEKKVTDLAKSLGLGKSTVSRLMATLASEGFVAKDEETLKYRLGLSILNLNTIVTSNMEIRRESVHTLKKLVNEVEETAHIAELVGSDVIYVNKVECSHPVQILSHIGRRNPAYCTSSGRVLLAYQDEELMEHVLSGELKRYNAKTVVNPEALREIINKVRENGYAATFEEMREGVASISAPIRDYTGRVTHAVSIIGPVHRIKPSNISFYAGKLIYAADEISARMGFRKS